jgi:hypothetical protein
MDHSIGKTNLSHSLNIRDGNFVPSNDILHFTRYRDALHSLCRDIVLETPSRYSLYMGVSAELCPQEKKKKKHSRS